MSWYVLANSVGYLGQHWEIFNNAPRRPRMAIVDLQHATKCSTLAWVQEESRRGEGVLGLGFVPVPIRFEGSGRDAKVVLVEETTS